MSYSLAFYPEKPPSALPGVMGTSCVGSVWGRLEDMEVYGDMRGKEDPSPRSLAVAFSQLRIKDPNTINV